MSLEKTFEKIIDDANYEKLNDAPKQCVQICDEEIVKVLTWLTSEKSKYAILYGEQPDRFADFDREYTPTELLEIYKQGL